MKDYDFNEKGVCNNPTGETLWQDGENTVIIAYCQRYGRWAYGYHVIHRKGRVWDMPKITGYDSGFATQNAARNSVIALLITHLTTVNPFLMEEVIKKLKSDLRDA